MAKDDNTLFRIECFVDSNKLGAVLTVLAGKVRNMSAPMPVINAKPNGKDSVEALSRGALIEMFVDWLHKRRLKDFRARDAREFLEEHGRSPASYSYLLDGVRALGFAKRTGNMTNSVWHLKTKPKRDYAAERARAKARQLAQKSGA